MYGLRYVSNCLTFQRVWYFGTQICLNGLMGVGLHVVRHFCFICAEFFSFHLELKSDTEMCFYAPTLSA